MKTIIYYCSMCDEQLVKKGFSFLYKNCNKCKNPYTYRCPQCEKEYMSQNSIRYHIENTCTTSKDFSCSVCKKKAFSGLDQWRNHMSHCGKTPHLKCKFCPFKTKFIRALQLHLQKHLTKDCSFIDQDLGEGKYLSTPYVKKLCTSSSIYWYIIYYGFYSRYNYPARRWQYSIKK